MEEKDLSHYWNCIFVLRCRISYLVGRAEGGERDHLHCSSQQHYSEDSIHTASHSQNTRICATCYFLFCLLKLWCRSSLFTWSTFWLGWKLPSFPPVNLMEITSYWLYLLEDRGMNITFYWMRKTRAPCSFKELRLSFIEQHAKTFYFPFLDPLLSLIYGWIT